MWRVLLADDEIVIVKGLHRLIDWQALQIDIVGEATDGEAAAELIEALRPDLVISDIRMPKLSGLDLLERFHGEEDAPKFIFISGYEEFQYVQRALTGGAVDYLLKPVSASALESAVRKALSIMEERTTAALMRESSGQIQEFFTQMGKDRTFTSSELSLRFSAMLEGRSTPRFAGLCFGLLPEEEERLARLPYERRLLQRFMIFNTLRAHLERAGNACFLRKDDSRCYLMGIFSPGQDVQQLVLDGLHAAEAQSGYRLRVGIGKLCENLEQLAESYESSIRAYELYYFKAQTILDYEQLAHQSTHSYQEFDEAVKRVFYSIAAHRAQVFEEIDAALDIIEDLHYGNRGAAFNRSLIFAENLMQMLFATQLVDGDLSLRQNALVQLLEPCASFSALREQLHSYYRALLPDIYSMARENQNGDILRVKDYLQTHYQQPLSLKILAEIACVSPHYFSAYFKAETGQNYKSYLTQIRLARSVELIVGTDLKMYEVAEQVGYNSVRRFSDAFRAVYEMSPLDYRRLQREK